MSRPRRFGKSLFLSTLKEIFAGNQALFEGLHIYDKWDFSTSYPVIRVNFGTGFTGAADAFDDYIKWVLSLLNYLFQQMDSVLNRMLSSLFPKKRIYLQDKG